jgi:tripeptide aminopeptidase
MSGTVEEANLSYIIRDHDRARFEQRKQTMLAVAKYINAEYGEGTVEVDLRDQYYNMREKIEPVMHVIDLAKSAIKSVGVTPVVKPIRGGTDGARLSFEGLPCPNIFAGGENFHSRYEYLPIPSLKAAMKVILEIVRLNGLED